MEWQHPEALYFILPLCAAWLLIALNSDRHRRTAFETFAATTMWSRIFPERSRLRFWTKLCLREVAIISGLVALAGPRFGTQYEEVVPRGSDLYVLIDVSRSMLADDVPPTRLGRAKADVAALVNRLEGERVGLVAFAGQAVVKCPLTVDYDSFRRSLDELDPDSAPRGGTAIGDAIRKALEVFQAKADRDQAILLITDGDDQQSYPLEAAAVAAERHVTIFTVGLGDAERGARIPQRSDAKTYLEYQGEQVWSKLDNSLLQQIALKTNGVYVPAGTRAYDLGELYSNHLQGRRGNDSASQQRIRRSERFQIFLAIALASLLIDLLIVSYRRGGRLSQVDLNLSSKSSSSKDKAADTKSITTATISVIAFVVVNAFNGTCVAVEPSVSVRDGLRLYAKEQYEEAREKFAAASEELDKQKSAAAAIASFDEACAWHRKGDFEKARDSYLRAGLSQDISIAVASHFNLGTLAAEKARTLCGEKPETVPADKRQEILDQLAQAVVAYRHCLELKSDHSPSRRNLELVRQWMKYYTDQWHEQDRQKRRDESNLVTFVEYLVQTQTALRQTVKQLPDNVHSDAIFELKRAQDELREEIPTLREKIADELRPKPDPQASTAPANSKEVDEGISLLQGWADTAGAKMAAASRQLGAKDTAKTAIEQLAAVEELERIWEAVIPFHPLLTRALADQTYVARTLSPNSAETDESKEKADTADPSVKNEELPNKSDPDANRNQSITQDLSGDDVVKLEEVQVQILKRTRLLAPKAEAELHQLESAPPPAASSQKDSVKNDAGDQQSPQVDPELVKAGYRKAIELGPQAVETMESAVKSLRQKDRDSATSHTEKARQILEEIQKAQPKNEQKQDQQNQDQQNNKDQKQQQDQKNGEDKKEDSKKGDNQKQDESSKKDDKQSQDKQQKPQQNQQAQMSNDRVEDALRRVRERQQQKRERDRKLKGQFLGKTPVDKDW